MRLPDRQRLVARDLRTKRWIYYHGPFTLRYLKTVPRELVRAGIGPGDTVRIGRVELEWQSEMGEGA